MTSTEVDFFRDSLDPAAVEPDADGSPDAAASCLSAADAALSLIELSVLDSHVLPPGADDWAEDAAAALN